MEAFAGLGFAANILQVVETTAKVLTNGYMIYQAGSTVQNAELQVVAENLTGLCNQLKLQTHPNSVVEGPLDEDRQRLKNLALKVEKIARELSREELRKCQSFLQAIKTTLNNPKIEETRKRLRTTQEELLFHLIVSIKKDIQNPDATVRKIVDSALQNKNDPGTALEAVKTELEALKTGLTSQLKESEVSILKRFDQILELLSKFMNTNDPVAIQKRIIEELPYHEKKDRFDDIAAAHKKTFEWAFEGGEGADDNSSTRTSIEGWLREGSGIYWISGKAGSGKSTLMKFLHQDTRTMEALKSWAGDARLIFLTFYFWNTGSDLQKSQEGLFRSLLFQALQQQPSLSPILFEEQYQSGANRVNFPTFRELRRAFGRLTNQLDGTLKVAMFIDGLDELDATHITMTELSDTFLATGRSSNFKALLSSRPLPLFESSFSTQPKLRLHHLTRNDITAYVGEKLGGDPWFVQLSADNPSGTEDLVAEIVKSASGVFLWVTIVVQSLLKGLQNYDVLEDLYKRLRNLPPDLEGLFKHMLQNIPDEYKVESSRIFQIVRCSETSTSARYNHVPLTAHGLYFAGADLTTCLDVDVAPLSELAKQKREQEVEGRLRSRCAGLLELRHREFRSSNSSTSKDPREIHYLHKSVADFFERDDVWNGILKLTAGTNFDPHLALLQSFITRLKHEESNFFPKTGCSSSGLGLLTNAAMHFVSLVDGNFDDTVQELLNELDRIMSIHFEAWKPQMAHHNHFKQCLSWCDYVVDNGYSRVYNTPHDNLLAVAVMHGCTRYVQRSIQIRGSQCIKKEGRSLLDYACYSNSIITNKSKAVPLSIVATLLQHGADPNHKFEGSSPWQNVVDTNLFNIVDWIAILKLFVTYGADPHARLHDQVLGIKQPPQYKWKTCLHVIKYRLDFLFLNENMNDRWRKQTLLKLKDWGLVAPSVKELLFPLSRISPTLEATLEKVRADAVELLRLLLKKGARDELWSEVDGMPVKETPDPLKDLWSILLNLPVFADPEVEREPAVLVDPPQLATRKKHKESRFHRSFKKAKSKLTVGVLTSSATIAYTRHHGKKKHHGLFQA